MLRDSDGRSAFLQEEWMASRPLAAAEALYGPQNGVSVTSNGNDRERLQVAA